MNTQKLFENFRKFLYEDEENITNIVTNKIADKLKTEFDTEPEFDEFVELVKKYFNSDEEFLKKYAKIAYVKLKKAFSDNIGNFDFSYSIYSNKLSEQEKEFLIALKKKTSIPFTNELGRGMINRLHQMGFIRIFQNGQTYIGTTVSWKLPNSVDIVLLPVSIKKFYSELSKQEMYFIGPDGKGGKKQDKIDNLNKTLTSGTKVIEAPYISYSEEYGAGVSDGRHRIESARQLGYATIYAAVDEGYDDLIKKEMMPDV